MTDYEFNEKYEKHIESGFWGLEFDIPEVADYLDKEFEKEIAEHPEFIFAQIKLKFGSPRIYSNSVKDPIWESKVEEIIKTVKKGN